MTNLTYSNHRVLSSEDNHFSSVSSKGSVIHMTIYIYTHTHTHMCIYAHKDIFMLVSVLRHTAQCLIFKSWF
jgi:hypothetical protein